MSVASASATPADNVITGSPQVADQELEDRPMVVRTKGPTRKRYEYWDVKFMNDVSATGRVRTNLKGKFEAAIKKTNSQVLADKLKKYLGELATTSKVGLVVKEERCSNCVTLDLNCLVPKDETDGKISGSCFGCLLAKGVSCTLCPGNALGTRSAMSLTAGPKKKLLEDIQSVRDFIAIAKHVPGYQVAGRASKRILLAIENAKVRGRGPSKEEEDESDGLAEYEDLPSPPKKRK